MSRVSAPCSRTHTKKTTGSSYVIADHPIKVKINEWLGVLAQQWIGTRDEPWALLLETERLLTVQTLSSRCGISARTSIVPHPDRDECAQIAAHGVCALHMTSHHLLRDLCRVRKQDACNPDRACSAWLARSCEAARTRGNIFVLRAYN